MQERNLKKKKKEERKKKKKKGRIVKTDIKLSTL